MPLIGREFQQGVILLDFSNGNISLISADQKKLEPDQVKKNKLQFKLIMVLRGCYVDRMATK